MVGSAAQAGAATANARVNAKPGAADGALLVMLDARMVAWGDDTARMEAIAPKFWAISRPRFARRARRCRPRGRAAGPPRRRCGPGRFARDRGRSRSLSRR